MAKDKNIRELPGISPAAVVGLTRDGIVTVTDLVGADFDRVAYLVDDYNEATRLVREAAKDVPGALPARRMRNQPESGQVGSTPVMRSPLKPQAHTKGPTTRAKEEHREPVLQAALEVAARGVSLNAGAEARAALHRRLGAACLLLEHQAEEAEVMAALILETAEGGGLAGDEVSRRFGGAVEKIIEECASLRAVPMLPSGKLPRYYVEMAGAASRQSRRVCAAHLLAGDLRAGPAWHARALAEGLSAGEPDELVALARTSVERSERAAA